MASREASRLNFARLPDALFYVLLLWRLSVARAAPALDEDGCDSPFAGPQRSEDVGAPAPIINLRRQPLKRT